MLLNFMLRSLLLLAPLFSPSLVAQEPQDLEQLGRFGDEIEESSALAMHGDELWTLNDSGNAAELYVLNLAGQLKRTVTVEGVSNVDWESMAHDASYLYVADTGNNANSRAEFPIYRMSWVALEQDRVVPERILFRYGDYQAGNRLSHNFDAEGLTVRGDELWLFSKNRGDGRSNLYRFPKIPGSYAPLKSQSLEIDALATGADIHPDSGELALLSGRRGLFGREERLWLIPTSDAGVLWEQRRSVVIKPQDQWEAVMWHVESGDLLFTHEATSRNYSGLARLNQQRLAQLRE